MRLAEEPIPIRSPGPMLVPSCQEFLPAANFRFRPADIRNKPPYAEDRRPVCRHPFARPRGTIAAAVLMCRARAALSLPVGRATPSLTLCLEIVMAEGPRNHCRAADALLVLVFLGTTALPPVALVSGQIGESSDENRTLALNPDWKLSRSLPGRFEAYFNDHFGFRTTLVRWLGMVEVGWLKVPTSPRVILGKQGFLFMNEEPVGHDHRVTSPFTAQQLSGWRGVLEARRDWLAKRGIQYVVVFAPRKQAVYPEALPRLLRRREEGGSRLDQLLGCWTGSEFPVVDLRRPLRQAKTRERLYHFTDTHWNSRAAFVGYQCVTEALGRWFPGVQPLPRSAFREGSEGVRGGDCARFLGLAGELREERLLLEPRMPWRYRVAHADVRPTRWGTRAATTLEREDPGLPKAVMFHDSFGAYLDSFLAEHFRRIVLVWERTDIPVFETARVDWERPDVVIQEIAELKLQLYWPDPVADDPRDELAEKPQSWFSCQTGSRLEP